MGYDVVVIGASWGGLHALETVLGALPPGFAVAVAVAQHRAPGADDALLGDLLDRACPLPVRDAEDKVALRAGEVLLAPPGYHMLVESGQVALSVDEPVRFSRPSVDVLFESAADAYAERTAGVLLTGANADGADGLRAIRERGGAVAVQDPEDAERPEMPSAGLEATPSARRLALGEVGPWLTTLVGASEERR